MCRLEKVFEALDKANFTLNIAKCHFAVDKIECLGFFISKSGVHADPKKVQAIVEFPSPDMQPIKSRILTLRGFIGAASFYRRFIDQFAKIVAPLHQLLKKNAVWQWGEEQETAFQQLKDAMVKTPVLALPCEGGEFVLQTESSTLGLEAVLIQTLNGESHPVTYISRRLDPAESNYSPEELACLAVVWALDKLRYYLYGRKFVVKTGSNTFKWLKEKKKNRGKFSNWIMEIQDYDFVVEHPKRTENRVTDAIANNPVEESKQVHHQVCVLRDIGYSTQELALLQQGDKTICAPLLRLQDLNAEEPKGQDDGVFRLDRGVLYKINPTTRGKKFLLVIPSSLRREIIQSCHDAPTGGHFGVEKTQAKVAERYWWPGLTTSIKTYVAACHFCQLNKHPTGLTEGMLQPIQPPSRPMEQYGMDHVGPFKHTAQGNRYILAAIDLLSKYVIAKAMPDTTTNNAIKFVHEEIIGHHGFPKKIITDRGTAFTAKAFAKALEDWGIRHTMSSTAHPQSNGQVERNHHNLITALKAFVNPAENDWDEKVTDAVVAINSSRQSSTGVSPYEIIYGQTMELPHERLFPWPTDEETVEDQKTRSKRIGILRTSTRQKLLLKQAKMKTRVDKHRRKPREYSPGDLIIVARNIRKDRTY
jgi:transposase InsO family protein